MIKEIKGRNIKFDTPFSNEIFEGIVIAYEDDCLELIVNDRPYLLDIASNDSFSNVLKKEGLTEEQWILKYKIRKR